VKNKDLLIEILGRNAFSNGMSVDSDVAKLVKSVDYLLAQLDILARWCEPDGREHISAVALTVNEILEGR
jgi:hypothetical protein